MNTTRKLVVNVLLSFLSILFLFLASEGITRLVKPNSVKMMLMHIADEKLGYRLAPRYEMRYETGDFMSDIRINSEGLRDREYPAGKDPSIYRIVVLGDSFTFGVGVDAEESYPKHLERLLNHDHDLGEGKPVKFEVVNAGVDGYGTEQEYLYLTDLLNRYKPDLVLVGLYSNDIADAMQTIPTMSARNKLKNRFHVLSYLRAMLMVLNKRYMKSTDNITLFGIYQDPWPPQVAEAVRKTEDYLKKIRDAAKSQGAKTAVVVIPMCFELGKTEWEDKGFGALYTDQYLSKNMVRFSDTFAEFGKSEHIPMLPLLRVLRQSTVRPLYFRRDSHWTRDGHRVAAEAIHAYLMKENLLGGKIEGARIPYIQERQNDHLHAD
jgi:lysophospholipase L1-like esterase